MNTKKTICALTAIAIHQLTFAQTINCPSKSQLNMVRFDKVIRGGRIWANLYNYSVQNKIPIIDTIGYRWIVDIEVQTSSADFARDYAYQLVSSMHDDHKTASNSDGIFYCRYDADGISAWTV